MNQYEEKSRGRIVNTLVRYAKGVDDRFDLFVVYVGQAIRFRVWEGGWIDELSGMQHAESFKQFVELEPPQGIGYSLTKMYAILKGPSGIDKDAKAALDLMVAECHREGIDVAAQCAIDEREGLPGAAGRGGNGANQHNSKRDNVTFAPNPRGNSSSHTLKRLKRDNPELAEQVVRGELSANAAAIQAGFRRPTLSIPNDPDRAAESILNHKHFGPEFAQALKEAL